LTVIHLAHQRDMSRTGLISDGVSIADVPSAMLNKEDLTLSAVNYYARDYLLLADAPIQTD
jgi:hypothetical protein